MQLRNWNKGSDDFDDDTPVIHIHNNTSQSPQVQSEVNKDSTSTQIQKYMYQIEKECVNIGKTE